MEYVRLGREGPRVSRIALGTMTWGEQNTPQEAFAQLDAALDAGVNLIDTAELYPVPPRAETQGRTEAIIGRWLRQGGQRDRIVLASKVCGPTGWCPHIRTGKARLDAANIVAACEASLKRLQTDYLDLYQTHWPDRNANFFGRRDFTPEQEEEATPVEETLEALSRLIAQGKVRCIGVSNETPWGLMRHLQLAEALGLPRVVSIQNPYNLLNRSFETGLAEIAWREQVGLLAYSPLAFGVLSGKYLNGQRPAGARLTLFADRYRRYSGETAEAATREYVRLAREHGLDPAQMAIAFLLTRPFVASVIIGATTMAQLQANLQAADLTLDAAVIEGIDAIRARFPDPCP